MDKRKPKLSKLNQTQNRRRYVKFENGSHFICSLNLNNPELTVFIVFKITDKATGINHSLILQLVISMEKSLQDTYHFTLQNILWLGLFISKAYEGAYVAIANDESSLIKTDIKFPSSNQTVLY